MAMTKTPPGRRNLDKNSDLFNHFQEGESNNQEGNIFSSKPDLTPTSTRRWTYWESGGDTPLPASPAGQTILHNCSSSPFSCPFCSAFSSVSYTAEAIAPDRRSRAPQQSAGLITSASRNLWLLFVSFGTEKTFNTSSMPCEGFFLSLRTDRNPRWWRGRVVLTCVAPLL